MKFDGRLSVQQRVLPIYRAPFFKALAESCKGGMSLFAGEPRSAESIKTVNSLRNSSPEQGRRAQYVFAKNRHILKGSLYFLYQQNIIRWLEETNPDALILEANPRYLTTPAAIRWMRERNRPVIGWGLGAPIHTRILAGFRQKSWTRFLNKFDALIAYSQRGADDYAVLGIPTERIFVAPNAVAPRPKRSPLPRPLRQPDEPLNVLFVGRLQARKRIDNLLRACAALPSNLLPRLWIVGDGPAREDLQKLAAEIYPKTRFFGAVHGAELNLIWAEADLFALPGTGGLAVQEAMSHGLPIIVAKGDGTQDDLVRIENGWQIPPDDLGALTATLTKALADQDHLQAMGMESYRIVAEEVNVETMVDIFVKALNQSCKIPAPSL